MPKLSIRYYKYQRFCTLRKKILIPCLKSLFSNTSSNLANHFKVLQISEVLHIPVLEREKDSACLTDQASYKQDSQKTMCFPALVVETRATHQNMTRSPSSSPSRDFINTPAHQYEAQRQATIVELKEQVHDLLNQVEIIIKGKAKMKEVTPPKPISTPLPSFTLETRGTNIKEKPRSNPYVDAVVMPYWDPLQLLRPQQLNTLKRRPWLPGHVSLPPWPLFTDQPLT
ncbi:hypothetical protein AMTR_s00072p00175050 [Amborella trichopoda]|uniref:Uncharacterized protein n=1 Tax=Amborella trichopoda TaxID=13333 RepID=W1NV01_AMBTC|nr:hypothetical protein AMTR_s00072p00175050 [Amborella trichopoda]